MKAAATRFLLGLIARLAGDTAGRVGAGLGLLACALGIRRRVVDANLARLGLRGPARRAARARSYATIGANFLELWAIGGVHGPEHGVELMNPRWLKQLHRRQPGFVLVSPHLGSWDMAVGGVAPAIGGVDVYAKPLHDPVIDGLTNAQRLKLQCAVLQTDRNAAVQALRHLRAGRCLGLLADQRPGDQESEPAFFLGQATNCHRGPGFFATRAKVAMVPALCLRVGHGRYRAFVGRPWHPPVQAGATQVAMDWCSAMVAAFPGQYFWHHKRFAGKAPALAPRAVEPWRARGLRLLVDAPDPGTPGTAAE
jgi:KDO2-lipid IV(A) lauroyltransferase